MPSAAPSQADPAEAESFLAAHPDVEAIELVITDPGGVARGQQTRHDAYSLGKLDDMAPVFDDIYAAARTQQLPLRTLMSEYAPGQFEITLLHRDNARRAIDDAIMFKRLIRAVAARHGLAACFMAKPFEEHAGSGMHMHLSLQDDRGENIFASGAPEGTPALRHATGGIQRTMAESMLIFAPNANSYRRLRRMSFDPGPPATGNAYERLQTMSGTWIMSEVRSS